MAKDMTLEHLRKIVTERKQQSGSEVQSPLTCAEVLWLIDQASAAAEFRKQLNFQVGQLDGWAKQSEVGGWSTHQVDPMRKRADELRRLLMP
jgi:hypothetical protein